ncbi:glycosyltransferase family 2 protein [Yersinia sp. 2466 StPb PI]|uniref:glycosyltransferase family 2 protein n=1 Tax=Yersinia sp. 2466 StPb PI TaxID=3061648 RepID=UPI00355BA1C1
MIYAVIVTFYPNTDTVANLLHLLAPQLNGIIIIDNTPSERVIDMGDIGSDISVVNLGENVGISRAQNIGIKLAEARGATDVILFDQDSLPSLSLIEDLLTARDQAINDGIDVAAVGPVHYDIDNRVPSKFLRTAKYNINLIPPDFTSAYLRADFIIASGSLISIPSIKEVGYMDETLFIDCVDIEWGFRALKCNKICIAAQYASMDHKIGDKPIVIFGRQITTHIPIRHYYFFRNVMLLMKRDYIPIAWKLHVFPKAIVQFFIFSTLLKPRFLHFKYGLKGFIHGFFGRSGAL